MVDGGRGKLLKKARVNPYKGLKGWNKHLLSSSFVVVFSLSHICSCHRAHTSLRSTFLKVSSFELSGSKLCFLLCPGILVD